MCEWPISVASMSDFASNTCVYSLVVKFTSEQHEDTQEGRKKPVGYTIMAVPQLNSRECEIETREGYTVAQARLGSNSWLCGDEKVLYTCFVK